MSDAMTHGFKIPHDRVEPTRDMVLIQIPFPPRKVGNIHVPDQTRDMAHHNVMAGRIIKTGPLAFTYKGPEGFDRQDAKIGDWVLIRPFAGTFMGAIQQGFATLGFRYVSSFQDVIGIIQAADMPDPESLMWTAEEADAGISAASATEVISQPRSSEKL